MRKHTFRSKTDIPQGDWSGLFKEFLSGLKEREGLVKADLRDNHCTAWSLTGSGSNTPAERLVSRQ